MSIADIVKDVGGRLPSGIFGKAFHVVLRENGKTVLKLGVREPHNPDTGQPNPTEIRYTQEFEIVVHKTVGQKPVTQCTIPDGLWNITMKFNTLKGTDGGLSNVLTDLKEFRAGPRKLFTALFPEGICTYIQKKEIVQTKGADDWHHTTEVSFVEANSGE